MTNIQEIIERSLYERLRLGFVNHGYTPNITAYPDTNAGYASYQAAFKTIATAKGFAVELFGASAIAAKGQLRSPRVVMDFQSFGPGDFGLSPGPEYEKNTGEEEEGFSVYISDLSTYRGTMAFVLVAETVAQERVLQAVLRESLPAKAYVPFYNSNGAFLILQETGVKTSSPRDITKEWVYLYSIPDIHFGVRKDLADVQEIKEISLNVQLVKELGIPVPV